MNGLGVSSACFYPQETERSMKKISDHHIPLCEIFFNAPSELEPAFVSALKTQADNNGLRIVSVHPFTAFMESYFLFSSYPRRFKDALPLYERYCAVAAALGARIVVIHGLKPPYTISDTEYFDRFAALMEVGKAHGVSVCQENVVRHRSEDPVFLQHMASALGKDFGVVLDIKQARRTGCDYKEFLDRIGDHVAHVHLSDYTSEKDCVPPGEGLFDFPSFFREMQTSGYAGDYVIELYRDSYKEESQIVKSYDHLRRILANI